MKNARDLDRHLHTSSLRNPLPVPPVTISMAIRAERNQILRRVRSELAPRLHVMHLQVLHSAAVLATPTVSFQHLLSDHDVFFRLQFESWMLLA